MLTFSFFLLGNVCRAVDSSLQFSWLISAMIRLGLFLLLVFSIGISVVAHPVAGLWLDVKESALNLVREEKHYLLSKANK